MHFHGWLYFEKAGVAYLVSSSKKRESARHRMLIKKREDFWKDSTVEGSRVCAVSDDACPYWLGHDLTL